MQKTKAHIIDDSVIKKINQGFWDHRKILALQLVEAVQEQDFEEVESICSDLVGIELLHREVIKVVADSEAERDHIQQDMAEAAAARASV
jgi:hypothetical protein